MNPKPDIDLSEFMERVDAEPPAEAPDEWVVTFTLAAGSLKGEKVTLTILDCHSEFDAKERAFLYLRALIYGQQGEEG